MTSGHFPRTRNLRELLAKRNGQSRGKPDLSGLWLAPLFSTSFYLDFGQLNAFP